MKLIQRNNSRLLGQSRIKVDQSILKELGWGSHTFSLGVCTYEDLDIYNFECAAYISESSLFVVTVDVTNRNREDKYEVPLSKIKDIELARNNSAEESLFNDEEKDSLRQRVVIFLRGDKRLYLDTYDSPHFGKYIYSAWESITINKCAGLKGKVRARADPVLAAHYHEEVINSFKDTSIDDWDEKRLIMDEIAEEVRLDLELKHLLFRSREFLTLLFEAAFTAVNMPTGFEKEIETKERLLGGNERESMDNYSYTYANTNNKGEKDTFNMLSPRENAGNAIERALYEVQKKIQVIMYHRLGFMRSAMQFLTDLFFCADSVASRSFIISEIGPLDMDTWLQLLVPDLFVQMAINLKCVSVLQEIESIGDNPTAYGSAMDSTDFESKLAEMEAEVKEVGEDESKLSLNTDKLRRLTIHQSSLSNVTNKMVTNLITLKRSMRDLQMIAAFELYRVSCQGKSRPDHVGMSRLNNRVYNAKAHVPLGDLWVRQEGYEECLEFLLVRCSNILDDMLLSEKERVTTTEHTGSRAARTNNRNNDTTSNAIPVKAPTLPPSPKRMMRKGLPNSATSQVPFGEILGTASGGTPGTGGRGGATRLSGRGGRSQQQQQQQKNDLLVSPASKRPVLNINTSWDESTLPDSMGNVKESSFVYSALETQEIVLYYMSSLLKALVMDSSKCREVTGKDNRSLWPPIIVVLDIICPRGHTMTHGDNPELLDSAASGKMVSEYAAIPHSPRATQHQSSGNMFMSFFQSCTGNNPRAQQKIQQRQIEMDRHTTMVDEVLNKLKHEHHEDLVKDAKYRKAIVLPW